MALAHPTQHTLICLLMQVCEKVESKGTTSYNEVADELVAELKDGGMDDGICYDEKNIRRRVYDAINVLMALDIIAKEKKAIIWKGFPTTRSAAQQVRVINKQLAQLRLLRLPVCGGPLSFPSPSLASCI